MERNKKFGPGGKSVRLVGLFLYMYTKLAARFCDLFLSFDLRLCSSHAPPQRQAATYTSCDQVPSRSPTCRKPARVREHTQRTPGQAAIAATAASAKGSSDVGLCFRSTAACGVRANKDTEQAEEAHCVDPAASQSRGAQGNGFWRSHCPRHFNPRIVQAVNKEYC